MPSLAQRILTRAFRNPSVRGAIRWVARQLVTGEQTMTEAQRQVDASFQDVDVTQTVHKFEPVSKQGEFLGEFKRWLLEGDTSKTVLQKGKVITQSGEIVNPEEVLLRCGVCGGFSAVELHCVKCGRGLCRLCAKILKEATISGTFCPDCYQKHVYFLDTWAIADAKKKAAAPPKPKEVQQPANRTMPRYGSSQRISEAD